MRSAMLGLSFVVLLGISTFAPGQEHGAARAATATAPHDAPQGAKAERQPALPEPSPMPGSVIILILGIFLAAAIVGPVVRYHTPEALPEPSDHDDHGHDDHGHDDHGHDDHGHDDHRHDDHRHDDHRHDDHGHDVRSHGSHDAHGH